jgi:hypothetical protein
VLGEAGLSGLGRMPFLGREQQRSFQDRPAAFIREADSCSAPGGLRPLRDVPATRRLACSFEQTVQLALDGELQGWCFRLEPVPEGVRG